MAMAKRVPWKHVRAKALTVHNQTLYERYAQAFEAANDLGRQLTEAVSNEWNDKYPDGIDGQICIFNVIGGALVYIMKDKMKQKESVKKIFDADRGDDVFSRPSAGHTSDLATVSVGTDQLDDTLAIIGQNLQDALTERAGNEEQKSAAPQSTAGPSFTERLRGTG
jgi:hypothetical protein